MFTSKTTVTTGNLGKKLSKSIDNLMDKGSELLDAGMKVMDEAFKEADTSVNVKVSTTIRVRLTPEQLEHIKMGATLSFTAQGVTILLEKKPS